MQGSLRVFGQPWRVNVFAAEFELTNTAETNEASTHPLFLDKPVGFMFFVAAFELTNTAETNEASAHPLFFLRDIACSCPSADACSQATSSHSWVRGHEGGD